MSALVFKNRKLNPVKGKSLTAVFSGIWDDIGTVLQRWHQGRQNWKVYSQLLENDEYLLRDIGVSREEIYKAREKKKISELAASWERSKATTGRL